MTADREAAIREVLQWGADDEQGDGRDPDRWGVALSALDEMVVELVAAREQAEGLYAAFLSTQGERDAAREREQTLRHGLLSIGYPNDACPVPDAVRQVARAALAAAEEQA